MALDAPINCALTWTMPAFVYFGVGVCGGTASGRTVQCEQCWEVLFLLNFFGVLRPEFQVHHSSCVGTPR